MIRFLGFPWFFWYCHQMLALCCIDDHQLSGIVKNKNKSDDENIYLAENITVEILAAPAGGGVEWVAGLAGADSQVHGIVWLCHVHSEVIKGV